MNDKEKNLEEEKKADAENIKKYGKKAVSNAEDSDDR